MPTEKRCCVKCSAELASWDVRHEAELLRKTLDSSKSSEDRVDAYMILQMGVRVFLARVENECFRCAKVFDVADVQPAKRCGRCSDDVGVVRLVSRPRRRVG